MPMTPSRFSSPLDMLSISLGPVALPVAPLVLLASAWAATWLARRIPKATADSPLSAQAGRTMATAVWLGLVVARLSHVIQHASAYNESPLAVLDIRDGGWHLTAGMVTGLGWLGWRAVRIPALRRALAAGTAAGLALFTAGQALIEWRQPASYPAVTLTRLSDGKSVTLAQVAQGRPVVVNLWASWCAPCRVEMPALAAAQHRHAEIGFLFINQGETPERVHAFLKHTGFPLKEVLLDASSSAGPIVGSPGLPTTLFLDPQGRRVDAHFGVLTATNLRVKIEALRNASSQ